MLLSDYIARGFPGGLDAAIASVGVGGIDRVQAQSQVRFCAETESALYPAQSVPAPVPVSVLAAPGQAPGADPRPPLRYLPGSRPVLEQIVADALPSLRYEPGSRPVLEEIVATLGGGTERSRAEAAMSWVNEHVVHPHHGAERVPPDRALSEEEIIASGAGWCNEQARVLIALAEIGGIAGRLCFVYHANLRCGHTAVELGLDGRWAFFDPTFDVSAELPGGRLAEARELSGASRGLAHNAYREPLAEYYERCQSWVEDEPGWRSADRPSVQAGGDLLAYLGFTDYVIDGVAVASQRDETAADLDDLTGHR